jgi:hypothetical protein
MPGLFGGAALTLSAPAQAAAAPRTPTTTPSSPEPAAGDINALTAGFEGNRGGGGGRREPRW